MSDPHKTPPISSQGTGTGLKEPPTAADGDERDELLRLASVVAHQLRSPLSSVQSVLTTVLGGFAGPLHARQRWLLEKALERCSTGAHLVRDLLRLRTVDQIAEDTLGPVNLVTAFTAVMDEFKEAARDQELELETAIEVPDADSAWIHGDATLIREILGVLLDNAIKYTPRKGRVTARVLLETDHEPKAGRVLCVEIVDSGIGIPPEGYERLFQEFYRAPNAKKLAAEGTGLGLAFAWRAARRLRGTLELEPAATGGVRAVVSFPHRLEYADVDAPAVDGQVGAAREWKVSQRVVIVGGVTAGSKAAARIMRLDPDADVTIVERGRFLAYSGCGLPYYISGAVSEQRALLETPLGNVRDPAFFHKLKNVRALDLTEAVRIDRDKKVLVVRNLLDQRQRELPYDRLILTTGARPVVPELPGIDLEGIHTLHGVGDAEAIRSHLRQSQVKDVVILGGGLLGCQITESASVRGARLTLVEEYSSILKNLLDEELAALIQSHLENHGVRVLCNNTAVHFGGDERVTAVHLADGSRLPCDFVLVTLGRRPDVQLAKEAGLQIGFTGAILVDPYLRTSDPDIYAAGDCIEQTHAVTGRPAWVPGAVPASIQGRVAANNVCGREEQVPPVTGTTIVKLFDWTVARTGLTERDAREAGMDPVSVLIPGPDRAHYMPNARELVLKLVGDRGTGRLLGAQGVGEGDVAKRIDVVATALAAELDVNRVAQLTLAYAPPFSMAMDNVVTGANVLRNKLEGRFRGISPLELRQRMLAADGSLLLDVRQSGEYGKTRLRGSLHIPIGSLRCRLHELPRDRPIVIVCSLGLRSYEASLVLTANGFEDVVVLDGGLAAWPYAVERLT